LYCNNVVYASVSKRLASSLRVASADERKLNATGTTTRSNELAKTTRVQPVVLPVLVLKHELVDKTMSRVVECSRSECDHFTKVVRCSRLETNAHLTSCLSERAKKELLLLLDIKLVER
jgi:hypothetical protein